MLERATSASPAPPPPSLRPWCRSRPAPASGRASSTTSRGLVLTVAHVVGTSRTVDVRLADGSTVDGQVVGADTATDIAVVRIDAVARRRRRQLATGTEPVVGQLTVAVGSPFGFDQTVTSGIVSAIDRVVNDVAMVQTDAAINPGNSGGPLVDGDGRVIGLSDVIFTQSGGSEGVGFAIQIDLARLVADQLVAGKPVQLALLGVSTTAAADGARGAQVAEVVPGSAADAAGLEVGDLIVSIDGTPIPDSGKLRAEIIGRAPGSDGHPRHRTGRRRPDRRRRVDRSDRPAADRLDPAVSAEEEPDGDDDAEHHDRRPQRVGRQSAGPPGAGVAAGEAGGRDDRHRQPVDRAEQGEGDQGDGVDQQRHRRLEGVEPLEVVGDEDARGRPAGSRRGRRRSRRRRRRRAKTATWSWTRSRRADPAGPLRRGPRCGAGASSSSEPSSTRNGTTASNTASGAASRITDPAAPPSSGGERRAPRSRGRWSASSAR